MSLKQLQFRNELQYIVNRTQEDIDKKQEISTRKWIHKNIDPRDHNNIHWKLYSINWPNDKYERMFLLECDLCCAYAFDDAIINKDINEIEHICKLVNKVHMRWPYLLIDALRLKDNWLRDTALSKGATWADAYKYACKEQNEDIIKYIEENHINDFSIKDN